MYVQLKVKVKGHLCRKPQQLLLANNKLLLFICMVIIYICFFLSKTKVNVTLNDHKN